MKNINYLFLNGIHESFHFVGLVFELLCQTLDGPFGELLIIRALQMTHQTVHNTRPRLIGRVTAARLILRRARRLTSRRWQHALLLLLIRIGRERLTCGRVGCVMVTRR